MEIGAVEEHVGGVAFGMSALYDYRVRPHLVQASRGAADIGGVQDAQAGERFGFRNIGRHHGGARDEALAKRPNSAFLEQTRALGSNEHRVYH